MEKSSTNSRYDLTFRVFVSSTFADFIEERDTLQNEVFPRIRDYCREKGARFQAIDLRWGVPRDVADNQQTLDLCLQELHACQQRSPGANLIVLVGERYGWRPLPPRIEATEFERLLAVMHARQARRLRKCYRRDDNAVPAEYVLRPRGRAVKRDRLARLEDGIRENLAEAALIAFGTGDSRCAKYQESATHVEIRRGVFESSEGAHALCYVRTIRGLPYDQTAGAYRDLRTNRAGEMVIDEEARLRIDALRARMASLSGECLRTYEAEWKNRAPIIDLNTFAESVEADLKDRIDAEMRSFQSEPPLVRERRIQLQFATERATGLSGRDVVLDTINQYLRDDTRRPLIVTGPSGTGKTSVLAKIWLDQIAVDPDLLCLGRIIGATPNSSELRPLLQSLCMELEAPSLSGPDLPEDLRELAAEFEKRLQVAASATDVIMILDGLDQIAPTDDAHSLHWLPQGDLPSRVKLILSLRTGVDVEHPCLKSARRRFPASFLQLPDLAAEDGREMLATWLEDSENGERLATSIRGRRVLQPEQKAVLLQGFTACPIPLYLKIAFEEACRWHSYDVVQSIPPDINDLLHDLFQRLERPESHGAVLPGRALGLLKCARRGLSEDELVDILSADAEVMDDFRRRSPDSPSVNTLPVVMWLRLASELAPYLVSLSFDGAIVLSFQHLQIADVVEKQYLAGSARQLRLEAMTQHFDPDREFPHLMTSGASVSKRAEVVNKRQVDELAWLLTRAVETGDSSAVAKLEQLLTDLRFIEAKCLVRGIYDLVADYQRALAALRVSKMGIDDHEDLVSAFDFVSSVSHLLARYPHETIPIARSALNPKLAEQAETLCRERKAVWIDRTPAFHPDPGALIRTLPGATEALAMDGRGRFAITTGRSSSAAVWDLETGELVRYLSGHRDNITCLALTRDGQRAVTGGGTYRYATRAGIVDGAIIATPMIDLSGKPREITPDYALRIWDVTTGAELGTLEGHTDRVYAVAISEDGAIVVSAAADDTVRVWNTNTLTCLEVNRVCLREVRSLSLNADGDLCVIVSGDGKIHLWHLRSCEWQTLFPPEGSKYLGASISPDGDLVAAASEHALHAWPLENPLGIENVTIDAPLGGPISICPSRDIVLAAAKDKGFILWKRSPTSSNIVVHTSVGHCSSLAISVDGRLALFASADGAHFLGLSRLSTESRNLTAPWAEVIKTARSGAQLIRLHSDTGDKRFVVRPLDTAAPGIETRTLIADGGGEFCAGGKTFVMWQPETISVWDMESGDCMGSLDDKSIKLCAAASDVPVIVTADDEHEISVWSALDQKLVHKLGRHREEVEIIELSADGRIGISGGGEYHQPHEVPGDYAVRVWDLQSGRRLHSLVGHSTPINHIVLDQRGTAAISQSHEEISGRLLFWDIDWGLCLRNELVAPMSLAPSRILRVRNMCFAPDGTTVAVGAFNNEMSGIRLFNALIGRNEMLAESDGKFWRLDFVRSGRVVIGQAWGGVRFSVWDFVTGDLLADYPFPKEFSPHHFQWVDVPPGRCAAAVAGELCTFEIRNLPPSELTGHSIITELSSDHERKRLAALWYVINNATPSDIHGKEIAAYVGSILDQVCLPVAGVTNEPVRHAAIKAAIAAGEMVLPETIGRLRTESNWRVVAALTMVAGCVARQTSDKTVQAALAKAAQHPDVRTRKQVALLLERHQNTWSEDLINELRRDNSVDTFLRRARAGEASAAELLYGLLTGNDLLENRLCPAADQEVNDYAQVLKNVVAQNKRLTTWPGRTHPYLEHLRFRRLRDRARATDPSHAAAYQNQVRYLRIAHDLDNLGSNEAELVTAIERLAALCLPVKRVLAVKLDITDDAKRAEKFLNVRDSVELIKAGWETITDETIRRTWTRLGDIEDVSELLAALGADSALEQIEPGIGAREWYTYLEYVIGNTAATIYCLANACAQAFPGQGDRSSIVSIFESAGFPRQARILQQRFAARDARQ